MRVPPQTARARAALSCQSATASQESRRRAASRHPCHVPPDWNREAATMEFPAWAWMRMLRSIACRPEKGVSGAKGETMATPVWRSQEGARLTP